MLKKPISGKSKDTFLEIIKELLRPPEATRFNQFPTAEVVFDMTDESEFHSVDSSEEKPIFVTDEPSNLPQFEPYTLMIDDPEDDKKFANCVLIEGAS